MVHLEQVTQDNIDELIGLAVSKEQESFVSTVAESLAQAYVYSDNAYPFAVYEDETLVGFIMMGYYEVKHYYTLWKFLIDHRYQNKGYGRKALELGIAFIKDKFNPPDIYTGVATGNNVAKNLYCSVGFEETGLFECGMEELRLTFKEYLYHGSPLKLDKLIPNRAYDTGFEEGCQCAVYATENRNMAICFSLGCIKEKDNAERTMMPEYGDKMIFKNCHPNYGGKGYLYLLDKKDFTHALGSQWVCYEEIVPEKIIEINVDDYLHLCEIDC